MPPQKEIVVFDPFANVHGTVEQDESANGGVIAFPFIDEKDVKLINDSTGFRNQLGHVYVITSEENYYVNRIAVVDQNEQLQGMAQQWEISGIAVSGGMGNPYAEAARHTRAISIGDRATNLRYVNDDPEEDIDYDWVGYQGIAIGTGAHVHSANAVAFGPYTYVDKELNHAVAIGCGATVVEADYIGQTMYHYDEQVVSFGASDTSNPEWGVEFTSRLINVSEGIRDNDVVVIKQLNKITPNEFIPGDSGFVAWTYPLQYAALHDLPFKLQAEQWAITSLVVRVKQVANRVVLYRKTESGVCYGMGDPSGAVAIWDEQGQLIAHGADTQMFVCQTAYGEHYIIGELDTPVVLSAGIYFVGVMQQQVVASIDETMLFAAPTFLQNLVVSSSEHRVWPLALTMDQSGFIVGTTIPADLQVPINMVDYSSPSNVEFIKEAIWAALM